MLDPAQEDINQALKLDGDDPATLLEFGELSYDRAVTAQTEGRKDESDQIVAAGRLHLLRGIELAPENSKLLLSIAQLEWDFGDRDDSVRYIKKSLERTPGDIPTLAMLAETYIANSEYAKSQKLIDNLPAHPAAQALADYLQGRLLIAKEEWPEALKQFESALQNPDNSAMLVERINLNLARCYRHTGNRDGEVEAYRRVLKMSPNSTSARLGIAGRHLEQNRILEAINEYRQLTHVRDVPPLLIRLLIGQNLRLPDVARDWREIDSLIEVLEKDAKDSVLPALLKIETLVARNRVGMARDLAESKSLDHPDRAELKIALSHLLELSGENRQALRVLEQARNNGLDSIELRLSLARLWTQRNASDLGGKLKSLEQSSKRFDEENRLRLWNGLARTFAEIGFQDDAVRLWNEVTRLRPDDLNSHVELFHIALSRGDRNAQNSALHELLRIDDENGAVFCYCESVRLIAMARSGDAPVLPKARRLLQKAAVAAPNWSSIAVARAQLEELEGNIDAAITDYQIAVDQGERGGLVAQRLVKLLYRRNRFDEVNEIMRRFETTSANVLSDHAWRTASTIALTIKNREHAVELAQRAVETDESNHWNYIWLGQALAANGNKVAAETTLRKAISLATDDPTPYVALMHFLTSNGETDRAAAVLDEAKEKTTIESTPILLGRSYALIGDLKRASELFNHEIGRKPDDIDALRAFAESCLQRGAMRQAELLLRRLTTNKSADETQRSWARRNLAITLAEIGGYAGFREALSLLAENKRDNSSSTADQSAEAFVLATRNSLRSRRRAQQIMQELMADAKLQDRDRWLLARLLEDQGEWKRAREMYNDVLQRNGNRPAYLVHYVDSLLNHRALAEASRWLQRLKSHRPNDFQTIQLTSRLMVAEEHTDRAIALIREYINNKQAIPADVATRIGLSAMLCDDLALRIQDGDTAAIDKLDSEAENLYRHAVQRQPGQILGWLSFLSRRGRVADAFDLCDRAWQKMSPEQAAQLAIAGASSNVFSSDQISKIELYMTKAIAADPDSESLKVSMADLRGLQGRYDDAVAMFRQILSQNPDSISALNNLGWLLALWKEKPQEALPFIERAIELAGPAPQFLDTRACVRIALGELDKAIDDLEDALDESPSAVSYLHLATANFERDDISEARLALRLAEENGLDVNRLHPLEREKYEQLIEQLAAK